MSLIWWLLPAVVVFWAVGAYNRLVRLRGLALQAFDALHMALVRQSELLQSALPAEAQPEPPEGDAWRTLRAALVQFNALLVATRTRGLDPDAIGALVAARTVLGEAWSRASAQSPGTAADAVSVRWDELVREAGTAIAQFDTSVARYNEAVRGFPAVILAWLFALRPARPFESR